MAYVVSFSSAGSVSNFTQQSFEDNSTLEGILADLVIPSVRRKELVMREKGLVSLGLCCLIAKVATVPGHVSSDVLFTKS